MVSNGLLSSLAERDDEDLSFLPKDLSPSFGTGSRFVSINTKLPLVEAEPLDGVVTEQLVDNFADSGGSPVHQEKLKTASSKDDSPFLTISDDDEDVLELQNSNACHLKISNITPPSWRGHLDNQLDVELLDLHDHCYARQAVMDNAVNRRAQELLKVVKQMRGECEVLKEREKAREKECEELRPSVKR
ncbi:hypothetical protein Tco_1357743 [Tanacetum coccineum]